MGLFLARYIESYHPNFYIPMSLVDENFKRAHAKNAVREKKFWFRKNLPDDTKDDYIEITLEEFFTGKQNEYKGLFDLLKQFCQKKES